MKKLLEKMQARLSRLGKSHSLTDYATKSHSLTDYATKSHSLTDYATKSHSLTDYATKSHSLTDYATKSHSLTDYATKSHSLTDYATKSHSLTDYATKSHSLTDYATKSHSLTDYATKSHSLTDYATKSHSLTDYATKSHSLTDYATKSHSLTDYATKSHSLTDYATKSHSLTDYATKSHSLTDYATKSHSLTDYATKSHSLTDYATKSHSLTDYATKILLLVVLVGILGARSLHSADTEAVPPNARARARDIGIQIGTLPTGTHNAITDVAGVKVGHVTLNEGDSIRTGVTAVIPSDDIWTARLFGAAYTIHGNGEATGIARINQAGWIESPILLTNTLSVGAVHDGVVRYIVKRYPDNNIVLPIVAECYDGGLNDISGLHVTAQHAIEAIENATSGPVIEGCVGGGTGMRCYGFKAGIGTSSRVLPEERGGWTIGVLVNSNGGRRHQLRIDGVPVGREITGSPPKPTRDGSFIIVIATDAPLTHRQLKQLAIRATHGLARTGTPSTDGSGEFVIAFSTANIFPSRTETGTFQIEMLVNGRLSSVFQAVIEATEEAIVNSMTMATTTTGRNGRTMHAIPLAELQKVMQAYRP